MFAVPLLVAAAAAPAAGAVAAPVAAPAPGVAAAAGAGGGGLGADFGGGGGGGARFGGGAGGGAFFGGVGLGRLPGGGGGGGRPAGLCAMVFVGLETVSPTISTVALLAEIMLSFSQSERCRYEDDLELPGNINFTPSKCILNSYFPEGPVQSSTLFYRKSISLLPKTRNVCIVDWPRPPETEKAVLTV